MSLNKENRIANGLGRAGLPVLGVLVVAGTLVVTAASALAEEKVVAKVGGVEITERELAFAQADLGDQYKEVPEDQRMAAVLNSLIDIKVLAQAAEQAGMAEDETFKARMAFLRDRALHNTYFQEKALNAVTEDEIKARYDKEIAAVSPEKEISARHILLKTKEEAEAVIKELDSGKDFAEVAKEKSTGPTGPSGGDLGFFAKGQMVPEFEAAAFALEKGAYTKEPVQTQFGWHVIKKEDEREAVPPAFEAVKEQVRQLVLREKYVALIEAARKDANVEVLDEKLKSQLSDAGMLK
ncbi:MAG: peptidylprolyl isomerase [Nitratireductor sp.]